MSLFCLFSLFVMGKLFLRKVKFYVRNVIYALCAASHVLRGQVVTSVFNAHSSSRGYAPESGGVVCPAGQAATGGGFEGEDLIVGSYATRPGFAGWSVAVGGDTDVTLSVVCGTIQE
jgi:hypothetical protein